VTKNLKLLKNTAMTAAAVIVACAVVSSAVADRDIRSTHGRILCVWTSSPNGEAQADCVRPDGVGYIVVVTPTYVWVAKPDDPGYDVFLRRQPKHSHGFKVTKDRNVFHTETHRGITCRWEHVYGGSVECNRADNHGYAVVATQSFVSVVNEANQIVWMQQQPQPRSVA
jgi:hypothetical protein